MIILRSITDSFNILLGSSFTHAALAVAFFAYWAYNDFDKVEFKPGSKYWDEQRDEAHMIQVLLSCMHVVLAVWKWHDFWNNVNHFLTPVFAVVEFLLVSWLVIHRTFRQPVAENALNDYQ